MSNVAGAGWDPRLPWLYPYLQKAAQKRKGGQIRFTNDQTHALERKFETQKYLSPQERKKLAKVLHLTERQVPYSIHLRLLSRSAGQRAYASHSRLSSFPTYFTCYNLSFPLGHTEHCVLQVKTWFQNRRAKWRRVRKDGEEEAGPALHHRPSPHSPLSDSPSPEPMA